MKLLFGELEFPRYARRVKKIIRHRGDRTSAAHQAALASGWGRPRANGDLPVPTRDTPAGLGYHLGHAPGRYRKCSGHADKSPSLPVALGIIQIRRKQIHLRQKIIFPAKGS
jgi:hypothetical protein